MVLLSPFDCEGAQGGMVRLIGRGGYNRVGAVVAGIGDVNSDGFADFLVGSQDDYVYLVFGAEGIVGDNIQHVIRELVTAPELKLVLGRHAHEENIHADSLLYMISSLGINPHECEAMFEQVDTIRRKNEFVTKV